VLGDFGLLLPADLGLDGATFLAGAFGGTAFLTGTLVSNLIVRSFHSYAMTIKHNTTTTIHPTDTPTNGKT
jgi:hypothetical protein